MNWDVAILCLLYLSMFGSAVLYHLYMTKQEAVIARLHGAAGVVWCALHLGYPQYTKELTVWYACLTFGSLAWVVSNL